VSHATIMTLNNVIEKSKEMTMRGILVEIDSAIKFIEKQSGGRKIMEGRTPLTIRVIQQFNIQGSLSYF
jgi:hypothetical protein